MKTVARTISISQSAPAASSFPCQSCRITKKANLSFVLMMMTSVIILVSLLISIASSNRNISSSTITMKFLGQKPKYQQQQHSHRQQGHCPAHFDDQQHYANETEAASFGASTAEDDDDPSRTFFSTQSVFSTNCQNNDDRSPALVRLLLSALRVNGYLSSSSPSSSPTGARSRPPLLSLFIQYAEAAPSSSSPTTTTTTSVTFVFSATTLLSGALTACHPNAMVSTCAGGLPALLAYGRNLTKSNATDYVVTIPEMDVSTPFAQMHPNGLSVNIDVFRSVGITTYTLKPSMLSSRASSNYRRLFTKVARPLMTNADVTTSDDWFAFIKYRQIYEFPVDLPSNNDNNNNNDTSSSASYQQEQEQQKTIKFGLIYITPSQQQHSSPSVPVLKAAVRNLKRSADVTLVLYQDREVIGTEALDALTDDEKPDILIDVGNKTAPKFLTRVDVPASSSPLSPSYSYYRGTAQIDKYGIFITTTLSSRLKTSVELNQSISEKGLIDAADDGGLKNTIVDVEMDLQTLASLPSSLKDEEYYQMQDMLRNLSLAASRNDPELTNVLEPAPPSRVDGYYPCFAGECAQGTVVARALAWAFDADIGFLNSGGPRGPGWAVGPLKTSDVWAMYTFANTPCTGTIMGLKIWELVNVSLAYCTFSTAHSSIGDRFLQTFGLEIEYEKGTSLSTTLQTRVRAIRVLDRATNTYKPLERLKYYTFATDSYHCDGMPDIAPIILNLRTGEEVVRSVNDDLVQLSVQSFLKATVPYEPVYKNYFIESAHVASASSDFMLWRQTQFSCGTYEYWNAGLDSCIKCANGMQHHVDEPWLCIAIEEESSVLLIVVLVPVLVSFVLIIILILFILLWQRSAMMRRDNSKAPKGNVAAIVFTDVQMSTRMWGTVPASMGAALDQHHAMIRAAIKKHGGYEVKTVGDSFMVAFNCPQKAAELAVAIQVDFYKAKWPRSIDLVYAAAQRNEMLSDDIEDDPLDLVGFDSAPTELERQLINMPLAMPTMMNINNNNQNIIAPLSEDEGNNSTSKNHHRFYPLNSNSMSNVAAPHSPPAAAVNISSSEQHHHHTIININPLLALHPNNNNQNNNSAGGINVGPQQQPLADVSSPAVLNTMRMEGAPSNGCGGAFEEGSIGDLAVGSNSYNRSGSVKGAEGGAALVQPVGTPPPLHQQHPSSIPPCGLSYPQQIIGAAATVTPTAAHGDGSPVIASPGDNDNNKAVAAANNNTPTATTTPATSRAFIGLRIRIGIHYGPVATTFDEVAKGYDYYGNTVNVAARLEAAGQGGQIIVSKEMVTRIITDGPIIGLPGDAVEVEANCNDTHVDAAPPVGSSPILGTSIAAAAASASLNISPSHLNSNKNNKNSQQQQQQQHLAVSSSMLAASTSRRFMMDNNNKNSLPERSIFSPNSNQSPRRNAPVPSADPLLKMTATFIGPKQLKGVEGMTELYQITPTFLAHRTFEPLRLEESTDNNKNPDPAAAVGGDNMSSPPQQKQLDETNGGGMAILMPQATKDGGGGDVDDTDTASTALTDTHRGGGLIGGIISGYHHHHAAASTNNNSTTTGFNHHHSNNTSAMRGGGGVGALSNLSEAQSVIQQALMMSLRPLSASHRQTHLAALSRGWRIDISKADAASQPRREKTILSVVSHRLAAAAMSNIQQRQRVMLAPNYNTGGGGGATTGGTSTGRRTPSFQHLHQQQSIATKIIPPPPLPPASVPSLGGGSFNNNQQQYGSSPAGSPPHMMIAMVPTTNTVRGGGGDKTSSASPAPSGGFDHHNGMMTVSQQHANASDVMAVAAATDSSHALPLTATRSLSGATTTGLLGADGHIIVGCGSGDEHSSQIATFRPIL